MHFMPRKLLGVLIFSSTLSLFFLFNLVKPTGATTASANSICLNSTVVSEASLGGSAYQSLGLDISIHPEILKYRIRWFNGSWSTWYVPGQDDIDWKINTDGTQRRIWAYFDDHTHEYEKCTKWQEPKPNLTIITPGGYSSTADDFTVDFTNDNAIVYSFVDGVQIPGSGNDLVGTMYTAGSNKYTFMDLTVGPHVLGLKACVSDLSSSCSDLKTITYTVIVPVSIKPVITNINAAEITSNSAVIKFNTDRTVESRVTYGMSDTPDGRNFVAYNRAPSTYHEIRLINLLSSTTYFYRVTVVGDSTGVNNTESVSYSFKTLAPPVEKKPDLTIKDIYASYSSNASVIKVKYCNEGNSQPLVSGFPATFYIKMTANGKTHTGTSDNSNYVLSVPKPGECSVTDGYLASYFSLLDGQTSTITAEADWQKSVAESNEANNILSKVVELPMYLIGIRVENIAATSATVKWNTVFLADSHIDYVSYGGSIYSVKNAKDTNFVLAHSLTLTDLEPNTIYSYSLTSYDQQGNVYATKSLSSSELGLNFRTLPGDKPDLMFTSSEIGVDKTLILPGDMVTFGIDAKNNSTVAIPAGAYLKWYKEGTRVPLIIP